MIDRIPTATYRIQLRNGVTFSDVESQLAYLADLGISHLYLSPIFAASAGSTHGYDIVDPTHVEADLGGREGFERLATHAHKRGLGVILDIVPNHTAFSLENPWLREVLRDGHQSRYASHFDIDWNAGPLALPMLPEPFARMLAAGRFAARDGLWLFDDAAIPLSASGSQAASTPEELRALHEQQHWRLHHWETERDCITHRRFFNVTSLIGMRVEDPLVFEHTHFLIFDLVRSGHVDGLRVDHVDGLADPKSYLDNLAIALPGVPVWVEKILVGRETLRPDWKTIGTTGYEAGRLLTRLLTNREGVAENQANWRQFTSATDDFRAVLSQSKLDVLHNELAAELHQLVMLAGHALRDDPDVEAGPESLREAIVVLLTGMDRYRTYIDYSGAADEDRRLIDAIVDDARASLRSSRVLEHLARAMLSGQSAAARAFASRFQQVSGALLAKAQEDTAGFRWTPYLAANEVGAEPDEATVSEGEANEFLALRKPCHMTLTSSHDSKRSEDSRMRLAALSHHRDAFASLVADATQLADGRVSAEWRWYITQAVLAIWGAEPKALQDRLSQHIQKAMREAKLATFWTRPVEEVEAPSIEFGKTLCRHWAATNPTELQTLLQSGEALILAQLALKCLMPGFPDIYRGSEGPYFALTDPDSRLPVDWASLATLKDGSGFAGDKARLTRTLLHLRKAERSFFASARSHVSTDGGQLRLTRSTNERRLIVEHGPSECSAALKQIWHSTYAGQTLTIGWLSH